MQLIVTLIFCILAFVRQSSADSVLSPPSVSPAVYSIDIEQLTPNQRSRIKVNGIRNAVLRSDVWGTLKTERTENNQLVPIKRFFLRISEDSNFQLSRLSIVFTFPKSGAKSLRQLSRHDPMFEVGFNGEFLADKTSGPGKDTGYAARLSASPYLKSGLFYHTGSNYFSVNSVDLPQFEMGMSHTVELTFNEGQVTTFIDQKNFGSYRKKGIDKGLIHLISGWHPVIIQRLNIEGVFKNSLGNKEAVSYSGLFFMPKKHG